MAREGLMDDTGWHGLDNDCPETPNENYCNSCIYWSDDMKECEHYLTPNKYNLTPKSIKKLKILDWAKLEKITWKNDAMKGDWYCHLEGAGHGLYDEPIDEFWMGFNKDNDKIDCNFTAGEGMLSYNFKKFYDPKSIENKWDKEIQSKALAWINELIDNGILGLEV